MAFCRELIGEVRLGKTGGSVEEAPEKPGGSLEDCALEGITL